MLRLETGMSPGQGSTPQVQSGTLLTGRSTLLPATGTVLGLTSTHREQISTRPIISSILLREIGTRLGLS